MLEAGLERGVVRREGGHRSQVTAGGAARHEDHRRVGAVLVAVLAHPGDHLLDVDQVIGERRGRAQAVVRADAHPALAREAVDEGTRLAVLPAAAKRSAVQVDQRRAARRTGAMAVDIEQVRLPGVAVADVRQPLDVATADEERREQDAAERKAAAQPSGHPASMAVRQPAPRPSLRARSTAGPACSPARRRPRARPS